jgi:hypothetical protein
VSLSGLFQGVLHPSLTFIFLAKEPKYKGGNEESRQAKDTVTTAFSKVPHHHDRRM